MPTGINQNKVTDETAFKRWKRGPAQTGYLYTFSQTSQIILKTEQTLFVKHNNKTSLYQYNVLNKIKLWKHKLSTSLSVNFTVRNKLLC